jgi:hypothetical protein
MMERSVHSCALVTHDFAWHIKTYAVAVLSCLQLVSKSSPTIWLKVKEYIVAMVDST